MRYQWYGGKIGSRPRFPGPREPPRLSGPPRTPGTPGLHEPPQTFETPSDPLDSARSPELLGTLRISLGAPRIPLDGMREKDISGIIIF